MGKFSSWCIKSVLIVLMSSIVFTVSYGVFTRFVLNDSAIWTGELSGYLLVWITFLGSAWAVYEKAHIDVDFLVEKFPRPFKLLTNVLVSLALIFFACLLIYYGITVSLSNIGDTSITMPLSMGIVYMVIPISGAIMLLGFIRELVHIIRAERVAGGSY